MSQLDFNQLVDNPLYRVSVVAGQTPEEMAAALRIREAEATQSRKLETIKLYALLTAIFAGTVFCMTVYFLSTAVEDKHWALGILQAIFTGGVFYGIGQRVAKA